jgi:2-oxoacid:acceptor oxidoreductase delta subunit (pyruvate/2-ketoisovalerate family)
VGLEKFEAFIREAESVLVFEPGWSEDNRTGAWRSERPVVDLEKCIRCDLCWIFCPDGCIDRTADYAIDYGYCKGCGICAVECPRDAIRMVREDGEGVH